MHSHLPTAGAYSQMSLSVSLPAITSLRLQTATKCKNHSVVQVAKLLKGFSSRMMRKHHRDLFMDKLYGKKFWSGGYFYRTVGAINAETVQRYVEQSQSKHWITNQG